MQPNKPTERPDGWYWVKNADSKWVVMELQGGIAYSRGSVFKLGPGREIGPRIPSPDEPAPRDAAPDKRPIEFLIADVVRRALQALLPTIGKDGELVGELTYNAEDFEAVIAEGIHKAAPRDAACPVSAQELRELIHSLYEEDIYSPILEALQAWLEQREAR